MRCFFLFFLLTQLSTFNTQLLGATVTWIGGSGDWNTPANWSTSALPGPEDDVVIDQPGDLTVTHSSGTHSVKSLQSQESFVLSGGSLSFSNATVFSTNLTLSGGTLTGPGDVTVARTLVWTAGTMAGSGRAIIANTGTVNLSGGVQLNRVLQNDGTATWTGNSSFQMLDGTFNNNGTFTASSSGALTSCGNSGAGAVVFNNVGTFIKQGAGTLSFTGCGGDARFNNTGTVDVQGGTLYLQVGGTQSGDFTLASGATLQLSGPHEFNASSDISGAGNLTVLGGTFTNSGPVNLTGAATFSGGTATFNGLSTSASTLTINGGTVNFNTPAAFAGGIFSSGALGGSGDVTLTGAFTWANGTMSGSGKTIIASAATLNMSTGGHQLNRVLQNDGTAFWTGNGHIQMLGGTINNSGTFTVNSASPLTACGNTGGAAAFNNAGTFIKQGAGRLDFTGCGADVVFNSAGTVDVQGGTLYLQVGGTQSGHVTLASGAALQLSGTHEFNASSDITGTGNLTILSGTFTNSGTMNLSGTVALAGGIAIFNGPFTGGSSMAVNGGTVNFNGPTSFAGGALSSGTLTGSGDVTITGTLNWTGGVMEGSGRTIIAGGATATLTGSIDHIYLRTIDNYGTMDCAGTISGRSGGGLPGWTINNYGTVNAVNAASFFSNDGSSVFNNFGAFVKTGSGTTVFSSGFGGVRFNNTGAVEVEGGTLSLDAGGTHSADFVLGIGTTLRLAGPHSFNVTGDIAGAGNLSVTGGTLNDAGTVNVGGSATFSGGTASFSGPFAGGNTLTINGGVVNLNGATSFALGAALNVNNGTVSIGPSSINFATGNLSGGTLTGSGDLTVTGTLTWTGGAMEGTGKTIIAGTATANLSGTIDHLYQRTIENYGTMNCAGTISGRSSGGLPGWTINNYGTVNAINAASFFSNDGASTFNNFGAFLKNGAGVTAFASTFGGVRFNNLGSVDIQAGTLTLGGGGTNSNALMVANGGALQFAASYTHAAGSSLTGPGTVTFTAGTHSFPTGTFNPTGPVNFTGGAITINDSFTPSALGVIQSANVTFNAPISYSGPVKLGAVGANPFQVTFNAPQTFSTLTVAQVNGILGGAGDLTLTEAFNLNEFLVVQASGKIIIAPGAMANLRSTMHFSGGRQLVNNGTVRHTGEFGAGVTLENATIINNGTWIADSPSGVQINGNPFSNNSFNNTGRFVKRGTGIAAIPNIGPVAFNNTGSVNLEGGTLLLSFGGIDFPSTSSLNSAPGTTLRLDAANGSLIGAATNRALFAPRGRLLFNGGGSRQLEVMSQDLGSVVAGFSNNFAYGTIELAGIASLTLVNNSDNSPGNEALYVDNLIVPAGCTLNLNGLPVYVRASQVSGTLSGGTLTSVADKSGPLALNTNASGAIAVAGEVDEWTFFGRAGQAMTVVVETDGGNVVPPQLSYAEVRVFDPLAVLLSRASNTVVGQTVLLADLALPVDGTYRVQIRAPANRPASSGNYRITVWEVQGLSV